MWSDRKSTRPPEPAPARSSSTPVPPPARSMSTPAATSASEGVVNVGQLTVIGKAMIVRGDIRSRESLHIEGEVDGSLDLPGSRLTVGPTARVGANARAREIEVMGTLAGDLEASKKITIRKGGRLTGDLRTPGIVIEEGAYFKGKIEIVNSEAEPDANSSAAANEATRKAAAGA